MQLEFDASSQAGTFVGDVLEEGLGNPEHPGRTRGVGSLVPHKYGLSQALEAKRERKRARKAAEEQRKREEFKQEILRDLRAEWILTPRQEQPAAPSPAAPSPGARRSSQGSIDRPSVHEETTSTFPCDDIEVFFVYLVKLLHIRLFQARWLRLGILM